MGKATKAALYNREHCRTFTARFGCSECVEKVLCHYVATEGN